MTLDEMTTLVRALLKADANVEEAESALAQAKEKARVLREESIPCAMQELGVAKLQLDSGEKIEVKQDVYATLTGPRKQEAFSWLVNNGFGGLIKTEVGAAFGRGDREKALQLLAQLRESGFDAELDESVHAQTLKAFLREQLAVGTNVPLELFNARPVWTAKISK